MNYDCIWSQSYDANMGAGTFHPHTFLKGIGPEPWRAVYVQPCRRPVDGRYGKSPYRFQHYYQLQVLLKPAPSNMIDIFLKSLEAVGISLKKNDIGLLEDDWKSPTLGAWGLGWEVRANGQEIAQLTYFQQLGGLDIDVVSGEITYGLERLFLYSQGYQNALDIPFNDELTYGDIFYQNEYEFSYFNFKAADRKDLCQHFERCEQEVMRLCEQQLVLPAYDFVLQASHAFNLLDARGALSVTERQRYIGRVRDCAKKCAMQYYNIRKKDKFPLLNKVTNNDPRKPLLPKQVEFVLENLEIENNFYKKELVFNKKEGLTVLFELGVEEMPPDFQENAKNDLKNKVTFFLKEIEISEFPIIEVSSRRISIKFKHVPQHESSKYVQIWGPAQGIAQTSQGEWSAAGLGFLRKNNIDPQNVLFKKRTDGVFLYAEKCLQGKDVPLLLAEKFKQWCYELSAPLRMKWLPLQMSPVFIRPVRWVVALVEDKVIPLEMFGLHSGRKTCGQRVLHPHETPICHAEDYEKILKHIFVEYSAENRQRKILENADLLTKEIGGKISYDPKLLKKCVGLFESPYVFICDFNEKYLRLPSPLIASVLKEHMNYFPVESQLSGVLLPYYVGVANYKCENRETMKSGTRNVVVGRLEDGAFYYDTDFSTPLSEFRNRLKTQIFQSGMGSLFEKSERIKKIVQQLSFYMSHQDHVQLNLLEKAAELCKADLKTGCVQEFPDQMQGMMGALLVRSQNICDNVAQSEIVAKAIEEHYLPFGASSSLPSTLYGSLLSLADKIDSLCFMISQGLEVQGNKDPLGLRRLAIGIARLLGVCAETNSLSFNVQQVVLSACHVIGENVEIPHELREKIYSFMKDRIKILLKEEFDVRILEALSRYLLSEPLRVVRNFAKAIESALSQQGVGSLLDALKPYRRAKNLTQSTYFDEINPQLFETSQESLLFQHLIELELQTKMLFKNARYQELLEALGSFSQPMAEFFENVLVHDPHESLKKNRLALLLRVRLLYEDIADFSFIQVP